MWRVHTRCVMFTWSMTSDADKKLRFILPISFRSHVLFHFPPSFTILSYHPIMLVIGVKGHFEVEVYASEPVKLTPLSDLNSRLIAGEWTETNAGGSHLNSLTFKKNPKFILKLRKFGQGRRSSMESRSSEKLNDQPPDTTPAEPARTRITVTLVGAQWKAAMKKDTVGCMIGFYVFIRRNISSYSSHSSSSSSSLSSFALAPPLTSATPSIQSHELTQIYESTFVPDLEAGTGEDFTLGKCV